MTTQTDYINSILIYDAMFIAIAFITDLIAMIFLYKYKDIIMLMTSMTIIVGEQYRNNYIFYTLRSKLIYHNTDNAMLHDILIIFIFVLMILSGIHIIRNCSRNRKCKIY